MFLINVNSITLRISVINKLLFIVFVYISILDIKSSYRLMLLKKRALISWFLLLGEC
jgi:hypothetical protein